MGDLDTTPGEPFTTATRERAKYQSFPYSMEVSQPALGRRDTQIKRNRVGPISRSNAHHRLRDARANPDHVFPKDMCSPTIILRTVIQDQPYIICTHVPHSRVYRYSLSCAAHHAAPNLVRHTIRSSGKRGEMTNHRDRHLASYAYPLFVCIYC